MSESFQNRDLIIQSLYEFSMGIIRGENGTELISKHDNELNQVSPEDVISVVDMLVDSNPDLEKLKKGINKVLNVLYKRLNETEIPEYPESHFLNCMKLENIELDTRLVKLKPLIRKINSTSEDIQEALFRELKGKLEDLQDFQKHYLRKENILFPYIEMERKDHRCLSVMWSFHDDIKKVLKILIQELGFENPDMKKLNASLGNLFFWMNAIKFREEKILFPVIFNELHENDWKDMLMQSSEIGYAFIEPPELSIDNSTKTDIIKSGEKEAGWKNIANVSLDFGTGSMSIEQAVLMLNHLPVDMTLIDKNDRVVYFSDPAHRVFGRSKAIIGREVQKCHPPESMHIVNQLLDSFKRGEKKKESFWVKVKDKMILIEYFALYDCSGTYAGTVEVSQDVSEIRELKGEKRLLDI